MLSGAASLGVSRQLAAYRLKQLERMGPVAGSRGRYRAVGSEDSSASSFNLVSRRLAGRARHSKGAPSDARRAVREASGPWL